MSCLIAVLLCVRAGAAETPADELAGVRAAATAARQAAAADPTIRDPDSRPVKAYLLEQQRRWITRLAGLRQRLSEYRRDPAKASLVSVLEQQLTDLEKRGPEQVSFDSAYGYGPATGLVGYAKRVRLLENTRDGKSIILVENAALVLAGLGTSEYPSGKFFGIDKAILVGAARPDYVFRGAPTKSYHATLVDLEKLLAEDGDGGTAKIRAKDYGKD
jgi:hypothetical protein